MLYRKSPSLFSPRTVFIFLSFVRKKRIYKSELTNVYKGMETLHPFMLPRHSNSYQSELNLKIVTLVGIKTTGGLRPNVFPRVFIYRMTKTTILKLKFLDIYIRRSSYANLLEFHSRNFHSWISSGSFLSFYEHDPIHPVLSLPFLNFASFFHLSRWNTCISC